MFDDFELTARPEILSPSSSPLLRHDSICSIDNTSDQRSVSASIGDGLGFPQMSTELSSGSSASLCTKDIDADFLFAYSMGQPGHSEWNLMPIGLENLQTERWYMPMQSQQLFSHEREHQSIYSELDFSIDYPTATEATSSGDVSIRYVETSAGQHYPEPSGVHSGRGRKRQPPTSDGKRAAQMEKNRKAAERCRKKKKAFIEDLQSRAKQEEEKRTMLKAQVEHLEKVVLSLKEEMVNHNACEDGRIRGYLLSHVQRQIKDGGPKVVGTD
jgi:hypothetical protein